MDERIITAEELDSDVFEQNIRPESLNRSEERRVGKECM